MNTISKQIIFAVALTLRVLADALDMVADGRAADVIAGRIDRKTAEIASFANSGKLPDKPERRLTRAYLRRLSTDEPVETAAAEWVDRVAAPIIRGTAALGAVAASGDRFAKSAIEAAAAYEREQNERARWEHVHDPTPRADHVIDMTGDDVIVDGQRFRPGDTVRFRINVNEPPTDRNTAEAFAYWVAGLDAVFGQCTPSRVPPLTARVVDAEAGDREIDRVVLTDGESLVFEHTVSAGG